MSGLFLSYRRADASGEAGRLYDSLAARFGDAQVFRDVDTVAAGTNWDEHIVSAVESVDALVAVIGPDWLGAEDELGRRRIYHSDDYVRLEIATALRREILTIPVLVRRADMPRVELLPDDLRPLARRQALELSEQRWHTDVDELERALSNVIRPAHGRLRDEVVDAKKAALEGLRKANRLSQPTTYGGMTKDAEGKLTATRVPAASFEELRNAIAQEIWPREQPLDLAWAKMKDAGPFPSKWAPSPGLLAATNERLVFARHAKSTLTGPVGLAIVSFPYDEIAKVTARETETEEESPRYGLFRRRYRWVRKEHELQVLTRLDMSVVWEVLTRERAAAIAAYVESRIP